MQKNRLDIKMFSRLQKLMHKIQGRKSRNNCLDDNKLINLQDSCLQMGGLALEVGETGRVVGHVGEHQSFLVVVFTQNLVLAQVEAVPHTEPATVHNSQENFSQISQEAMIYEVWQKSNETSNTASDLATLRCSFVTDFFTSKGIPVVPQPPIYLTSTPVTFF